MKPPRILIADDERHIVQVLSLTLTKQGYDVVTAGDGDAAWQAVLHQDPDLIITDQAMPGLTGTELASQVQTMGRDTPLPVMIVTAKQLAPQPWDVSNVAAILPKPFSPRQVLAHVAELVGPARPIEEKTS